MKMLDFFSLAVMCCLVAACAHQNRRSGEPPQDAMDSAAINPLLGTFTKPFGVPPFERIRNAHYLPAFQAALKQHVEEIAGIAANPAAPDFENTLAAIDRSGAMLKRVAAVFYNQLSANTDDELDQIAQQVAPLMSKHQDDILLNKALFARIKAVHEQKDGLQLLPEQATLLEETYRQFVRGGANLNEEQQAQLRKINEELSLLMLKFSQNILKEDNRFELVVDNRADLAGLPEREIEGAAKAAKERGHEGKWVFTLHKPSLIPFLQYSEKRELREKMFKGYIERGAHGDEFDNRENIKRIVALRTQQARLLGFPTYAEFVLDVRMAKRPDRVYDLLNQLWKPAIQKAKREAAAFQALIDQAGGKFKLQPWDWWYYAEKERKAKYDLDENELRPYFQLDNVLRGAHEVAGKLYGIQFVERKDIPKYHPDVRTFEVLEADGKHIGLLFVDYFPRASKRGGAWCGGFRAQHKLDGKRIAPLVINVGNFSMPTADKPALLSFEEVTTLFHEFGHALHSLFSDTVYELSPENVKVDFVELPSQIMENWASEPEVLRMYAKHYQTGETIPDALIAKIVKSRTFNQGFETVEYLAASLLDMDWHTQSDITGVDPDAFESQSMSRYGLISEIVPRYKSPYFRHVFGSDYYAAGYYSYIWAAVLDADAFEAFKEAGLFDHKTAQAFRQHVLSRGGAEDPMELYKRFRGAEPRIEPLLKRRGLLDSNR